MALNNKTAASRRILLGSMVVLSLAEAIIILVLSMNDMAKTQKIELLEEQKVMLYDLRVQEEKIGGIYIKVSLVCQQVLRSTFVQLGVNKPGSIGESVVSAFTVTDKSGVGGSE